ncbi:MAG: class I SAM-dependent methyltransferase, partial [Phototrophicaceae bacterium]
EIVPLTGQRVVEFGAGTSRVTRLLAPFARSVHAFDNSLHMLSAGAHTLPSASACLLAAADNSRLPLPDACADVALAGWSFGHACGWFPTTWPDEIGRYLAEMRRVLRPGGMAIVIETQGTGQHEPAPPTPALVAYYRWLETQHASRFRWIRTDYQFASVTEADELTRFFFGDDLADRMVRDETTRLPECTGIWWRTY